MSIYDTTLDTKSPPIPVASSPGSIYDSFPSSSPSPTAKVATLPLATTAAGSGNNPNNASIYNRTTPLPSGVVVKDIPPSLGGGAFNMASDINKLVNTGHSDYAGLPPKPGFQRNDIVPVSLGGSNTSPSNVQYQPLDEATYRDNVEKYFNSQVQSGKIPLNAARVAVLNWQNTDIPGQVAYARGFGGDQNVLSNFVKEVGNNLVVKPLQELWNIYQTTPSKIVEDIQAGAQDIQNGNVVKGTVKSGARVAGDVANAIFAPLSVAIGSALSAGGGQKLLDDTGKVIADKSGITDIPAFQEFAMSHPNAAEDFNRLLMLALSAGKGNDINPEQALADLKNFTTKVTGTPPPSPAEVAPPVTEQPPAPVSTVPTLSPQERLAQYSKSQGYEPVTPPDQLPVIQAGPKAQSELPVIQAEAPKVPPVKGDLTYEPVKNGESATVTQPKESPLTETTPGVKGVKVQKTGDITKAASDINATLVKQGFDSLSPEEQSHYTPESYKEIADNLTKANPEDLKQMATGEAPLDKKLYGQGEILYKTIGQLAAKEGDFELMTKLARSPLGKKLSLAGQTLGEAGYVKSDGSIDTVGALRQISSVWDTKLKTQGKSIEGEASAVEKGFRETIKKTASPRQSWEDFAKQIACSY